MSDVQHLTAHGQLPGELEAYDGHWSRRRPAYGAPDWDGKVSVDYDEAQHIMGALLDHLDDAERNLKQLHKMVDQWMALLETAREEIE